MKLENQVCSLYQAKRLNEFGILQGVSLFFHNSYTGNVEQNEHVVDGHFKNAEFCFSAFTVAELGIMLGDSHPSWSFKRPKTDETIFICTMIGPNDPLAKHKYRNADLLPMNTYAVCDRYSNTEAEARADLLITMMLVNAPGFSADEVNKRLLGA